MHPDHSPGTPRVSLLLFVLLNTKHPSRDNQHGIKANMKAVLGELYFLEKSLIFVAKQPTVIDYSDVHQVIFSRYAFHFFSRSRFA